VLKNFLFKRPEWFKHEGYWRLAQVFRIGPSAFCFILGILAFFYTFIMACSSCRRDQFGYVMMWFAASISLLVAFHFLIRLIVWIIEGFKGHAE
jgi:hypothetical protein